MEANGRSSKLAGFFNEMSSQGRPVVQESPKLDLELYIQNYKGRTRYDRLYHIGRTSTVLCVEALKAAIAEAKSGNDVGAYRNAVDTLREVAPNEPEAKFDQGWADAREISNKKETQRLEAQLRGYKNNLVRESVRIGHEDLGRHYEAIGALQKSMESFANMRPDAGTSKHLVEVGKHLVRVAMHMRDWPVVIHNVGKVITLAPQEFATDMKTSSRYLRAARAIAQMQAGSFEEAARNVVSIPMSGDRSWNEQEIASPNDIASYGAILALATMERPALRASVLESSTFRPYLELEPHLRKALNFYVNGKYKACLEILESYRPEYLLDLHLHRHIPDLYRMIRTKCIVQYLIPYSYISLDSLSQMFGTPGVPIAREICQMIRSGALNARINSIEKQLVLLSPDPRAVLQREALDTATWFQKQSLDRMRTISLKAAGLEARTPRRVVLASGDSRNVDDGWYSDGRDPMDMAL
ncbi:related to COP9 signalosome complex subunit 1 (G protein pathway suppressor 1) [Cephalotrichum gorgonifer]|uniref:Related to COP9 signalosome complex subunit 1 (G protein pathway suppressor 1) n=1 Tax=Cephalotrichum gorgonifer TaxID=2041049 RepID=A0AAE8SX76_9PEZI|nr:related to COP9 signalosome complex subunit 1 (G protein pathway suppressor 1) [Cephalotrichum gorgonifer]